MSELLYWDPGSQGPARGATNASKRSFRHKQPSTIPQSALQAFCQRGPTKHSDEMPRRFEVGREQLSPSRHMPNTRTPSDSEGPTSFSGDPGVKNSCAIRPRITSFKSLAWPSSWHQAL